MIKKVLIVLLLLLSSLPIAAQLSYNPATGKYYSKGARRNVDQNYYHALLSEVSARFSALDSRGATEAEYRQVWIILFSGLRQIGNPTALRLLKDLENHLKVVKKDMRIFNRL